MPVVSVEAMRQAFFRDAKAKYGAAAFGAGLFGSLLSAWQVPLVDVGPEGEDKGKGGKYLILPPNFNREIPAGYIPVRSETYNGYGLLRVIPKTSSQADVDQAVGLVKKLRIYSPAQASNPPEQCYIDMAGRLFDGIVRFDDSFFDSLAKMIDEEPIQSCDLVMLAQLRSIGIDKGKAFRPDQSMRELLKQASVEAHEELMEAATKIDPYWRGSHWGIHTKVGAETAFSFRDSDHYSVDERALVYFLAFATPKKLGAASFYLATVRDAQNEVLTGDKTYHLHVPANVPAQQYWAVTAYDLATAGFMRDSSRVGIDSYNEEMQKNEDGAVDIYFGVTAPAGKESNWVYISPAKPWFLFFRFYGPEKALFDKTWRLSNLEPLQVNQAGRAA